MWWQKESEKVRRKTNATMVVDDIVKKAYARAEAGFIRYPVRSEREEVTGRLRRKGFTVKDCDTEADTIIVSWEE